MLVGTVTIAEARRRGSLLARDFADLLQDTGERPRVPVDPNPHVDCAQLVGVAAFRCRACGAEHRRTPTMREHRGRWLFFRCPCGRALSVPPCAEARR